MKATQMSELEQEVMDIIWNLKEVQVRDVLEKMQTKKNLAYTTIATIFNRLEHKGLLNKNMRGSAYLYSPKVTKESYLESMAKTFLGKFISSYGSVAIASFAESIRDLPENRKKYLLELLEFEKNDKQ
jgi:predicted transcriptional regulator